jgi:hypothetical protein
MFGFDPSIKIHQEAIQLEDIIPYQLDAWRAFANSYINIGDKLCSPMRPDKTAKCYLYEYDGMIRLADWHQEHHGCDIVGAVCVRESLSYQKAIQHIWNILLNGTVKHRTSLKFNSTYNDNFKLDLRVRYRNWELHDLEYWFKGNISLDLLQKENVKPISKFWKNSKYNRNKLNYYNVDKYAYCYNHLNMLKVYQPFRSVEEKKFVNAIYGNSLCGNLPLQRNDLIIIPCSKKDYLTVAAMNISDCRHLKHEGGIIPNITVDFIKNTYKNHLILYDGDNAGIKAAEITQKRSGLNCATIPPELLTEGISDIFDVVNKYDQSTGINVLKKLL